jgi:cytochrome oxidase Cu insertion factor (SCO1/SenC/PrrC family)
MSGIISTLKKLDTLLTIVQMWKQYNKFHETNTVDMDVEELMSHRKVLILIKKDLNFAKKM